MFDSATRIPRHNSIIYSSLNTRPAGSMIGGDPEKAIVAAPSFISTRCVFPFITTSIGIGNGKLFGVSHRSNRVLPEISLISLGSFGCRR
ncbi:MAG: hypothetical protein C4325_04125 [Blastocatellia bacterium]